MGSFERLLGSFETQSLDEFRATSPPTMVLMGGENGPRSTSVSMGIERLRARRKALESIIAVGGPTSYRLGLQKVSGVVVCECSLSVPGPISIPSAFMHDVL